MPKFQLILQILIKNCSLRKERLIHLKISRIEKAILIMRKEKYGNVVNKNEKVGNLLIDRI